MNVPDIETARLHFRRFTMDDWDALAELFSDPEVVRFLGDGKPPDKAECLAHLRNFIENYWTERRLGRWALIHKEDGKLIGYCGLRLLEGAPELTYVLAKAYWGRGLATEAARACLRYGFVELRLERIVAVTRPENVASQHVMEKLAMKCEGEKRFYGIDCIYYSISRQDYQPDASPYLLCFAPSNMTVEQD
ncbi:MAG TPA: GNAT family N-acetyltransferase [Pyrinomonadaceae bacterium]|jgi:ribosomal-protein-alanine N-acetyltransferase